MHPQLQLIYPHHMIVIWLEYVMLLGLAILFIDLIIALVLLVRSRSTLLGIERDVHALRQIGEEKQIIIKQMGTDIASTLKLLTSFVDDERQSFTQTFQQSDEPSVLGTYIKTLTDEQKQVVRENFVFDNHTGYTEQELGPKEVLNEQASLDTGIPIFDKVAIKDIPARVRRKKSVTKIGHSHASRDETLGKRS